MRILLIAALCVLTFTVCNSSVIGIDFGSEFFKVSLISPGKSFVVIENTTTKRKTENAIAFYNKERIYESEATAKRTRIPRNTFVFLNKFLGALQTNQELISVSKENFEDYLFEMDIDRGTFAFKLENFSIDSEEDGKEDSGPLVLKVEELVGMILKYANKLIEKQFGMVVKQCVITVPSGWNLNQRSSLKQAARIAGLETLSIMNENSAAALYYGLQRIDNTTHTVIFYNVGAYNLQVTLAEYLAINATGTKKQIESVRILSDYSVPNVGGIAYDRALAHYFAKQFDNQPSRKGKKSITQNVKAFLKLLKASNKIKEVLSANRETPVYVEGLIDNEDFKSIIDRDIFEAQSQHLFEQLTKPIDKVLQIANKTISDISIVELIGGGIRIPKIQSTLNEYFGAIEVGTHLNSDESMALGAAFHAANQSHSFKVRPVHYYDGFSFDIGIEISSLDLKEGDDNYFYKQIALYPYKKRFGTKKTVNFNYDQNVKIEVKVYNNYTDNESERVTKYMTYFLNNITGLKTNELYKDLGVPKIHLEFEISSDEFLIFEVAELWLNETKVFDVEIELPKKVDPKTLLKNHTNKTKEAPKEEAKGEDSKKEDKKEQVEQSEDDQSSETQGEEPQNNVSEESTLDLTEETSEEAALDKIFDSISEEQQSEELKVDLKPKTKKVKKTITHEIAINVTVTNYLIKPLNDSEIKTAQKLIRHFESFEEKSRKLSQSKNQLEGFIYRIRDTHEAEEFVQASTKEERDELLAKADIHSQFLDGDDAPTALYEEFNKRYVQLVNLMKPIVKRLEEQRVRPAALNDTITKIADYSKKLEGLNHTMPWVKDEQKIRLNELLTNTTLWLNESIALQEKKQLFEDPAFSVEEIIPRMESIQKEYLKVKAISKPRKKKETNSTDEGKQSSKEGKEEKRRKEKTSSKAEDDKEDDL